MNADVPAIMWGMGQEDELPRGDHLTIKCLGNQGDITAQHIYYCSLMIILANCSCLISNIANAHLEYLGYPTPWSKFVAFTQQLSSCSVAAFLYPQEQSKTEFTKFNN